eukprot:1442295-Pyramimonas_sp.AAC.1
MQCKATQCKTIESTAHQCRTMQSHASNGLQIYAKECKALESGANQFKIMQSTANAKQSKAKQCDTPRCKALRRNA